MIQLVRGIVPKVPLPVPSKATRLASYVSKLQNADPHKLAAIACSTNPLLEPNEHIVALMILFRYEVNGTTLTEDDKGKLLDLLIDRSNKNSLKTANLQDKNDHAYLKAETAIVLAQAGVTSLEFTRVLIEILNTMDEDPFFQNDTNLGLYYKPVLSALYLTDQEAAMPFIDKHHIDPITIDSLEKVTLTS